MLNLAYPLILGNLLQQGYNIADTFIIGRNVRSKSLSRCGVLIHTHGLYHLHLHRIMHGMQRIVLHALRSKRLRKPATYTSCFPADYRKFHTDYIRLLLLLYTRYYHPHANSTGVAGYDLRLPENHFMGIWFVYLYNYYAYLLRALGNSLTPLIYLAISVVLNIMLDIWFIVKLHYGIEGAAAATIISQAVSAIGLCFYCWKKVPETRLSKRISRSAGSS